MTIEPKEAAQDVPSRVFESFLQELASDGVADEMIARLRQTLVEDKTFTENALNRAIFGKESDT